VFLRSDFTFESFNSFKFGKIPKEHLEAVRYHYIVRRTGLHSSEMRDAVYSGRCLPLAGWKVVPWCFAQWASLPSWKPFSEMLHYLRLMVNVEHANIPQNIDKSFGLRFSWWMYPAWGSVAGGERKKPMETSVSKHYPALNSIALGHCQWGWNPITLEEHTFQAFGSIFKDLYLFRGINDGHLLPRERCRDAGDEPTPFRFLCQMCWGVLQYSPRWSIS